MPLRSKSVDNSTMLDEIGTQISPSKRLHNLVQEIAQAEVRKLAISLMFPLLEKFIMPIKLV